MARSRTGRNRNQYPLFQLWKPSGNEEYERVYESSSGSGNFTMSDVSGITIGEFLPHDPMPFHSGYMLGEYNHFDSRLSVIHASVSSGFGRNNYVRRTVTSLAVFNTSGQFIGNDEPLVAVNTSEKVVSICLVHVFRHVMFGSITLEWLLAMQLF